MAITQLGKAVAFKNAYHDVQDEMFSVMELIEALSCSNVKAQLLEPVDVFKQARRAKDGKLPIYETKILTIPASPRFPSCHCDKMSLSRLNRLASLSFDR